MSDRTFAVVFTATAAQQAQHIDEWWQRERPAAPQLFFDELGRAVERLATMPGSGARFRSAAAPGLRRALLRHCDYHVYYTIDSDRSEVLIRAVWHAARGRGPTLG